MPEARAWGQSAPMPGFRFTRERTWTDAFILFSRARSRVNRATRIPERTAQPGQAGKNTSGGFSE